MKFGYTTAAGLYFVLGTAFADTIDSGEGVGTYYYDIQDVDTCGTSFSSQNLGGVMCSSQTLLSLNEMNTNFVVAMSNTELGSDPSKYCGKKVVVTVNGKTSDMPLFIGDGCQRCSTEPGLDFSYSVLNNLTDGGACDAGHVPISWEILDESIYDFANPGSSGSSGSSQASTPTTLATSAAPAATGGSCENNAWQCNGNSIVQCVNNSWTTVTTCSGGSTCQGDTNPYCA